ncbi:hypothetical protein GCM10023089_27520 [Quisquiliibacterium transsilvanicum]|nr:DUF1538 domain-containing protein [Quisquiliibacterium transsilvanicum]
MLELAAATAWSVAVAVAPLLLLFLVFQVLFLGLPVKEVSRILVGTLVAGAGLFLFLLGVSIAFLPFGKLIGEAVATLPSSWMAASFGAVLGFVTAWGEPAVRVLANEVEEASGGAIRGSMVLLAICVGVAASVAAGMLRIIHGIPLLWFVLPGYGLALAALWLSDRDFVAIAFDSGGVATGPLANSFLLALALGASSASAGQDPLVQGLGLVALIALAPVLSVMTLGVLIRWQARPRRP